MYMEMEQWARVRRRVLVGRESKRKVMREEGLAWATLKKILEVVSQVPESDEGTGDVEEALIDEDIAILPDQEAAEILEPSERALNLPAFAITA
jgi:hypothetical protein